MFLDHVFRTPNPVPIEDISVDQWLCFVRAHLRQDHRIPESSDTNRLGIFDLSIRRLCDLGVMRNPRFARLHLKSVWFADWIPPETLQGFLGNTRKQYDLFSESMRLYSEISDLLNMIGIDAGYGRLSLSGILSLAHIRGSIGAIKYVVGKDRKSNRYSISRNAFVKANGIF